MDFTSSTSVTGRNKMWFFLTKPLVYFIYHSNVVITKQFFILPLMFLSFLRSTASDLIAQESENRHQQHTVLHLHRGGIPRIHHLLVQEHRTHHAWPAHLHPGTTQRHAADHRGSEVPLRSLPVLCLQKRPHSSGLFHYSSGGYVDIQRFTAGVLWHHCHHGL